MSGAGGFVLFNEEQYLRLPNRNLLREVLVDIYKYERFTGGMAPKNWREALNSTVPAIFSEMDQVREALT